MHSIYTTANSASPANKSNEDDLYSQQSSPRTSCGLYNESVSKNSRKEGNKKKIQCCCLWWLRYFNATPAPFISYLNSNFLKMLLTIRILLLFTLVVAGDALPPVIRIGAIFTEQERNSNVELAFKYAIYGINKDKLILPNTQLVYSIEYVSRDDSFHTAKKVCGQLETGVQAIFGPSDSLLSGHIQSICDALNIPHIETRIELETSVTQFSINLYPSQRNINLAYRDLMIYLNWTNVAIIYEEDYGLFRQQDLVNTNFSSRWEMCIRQATPATYRQVLRSIRHKEIYKLIIDTNPSNIKSFFRADIDTFDLEDFKYNSVNITAFRLVDVESKPYIKIMEQMQKFQHSGADLINGSPYIQTNPALMLDSVNAFVAALMDLHRSHTLRWRNISCNDEIPWSGGLSLYNYINAVTIYGLTGKVHFQEGRRNTFKLDLLKLKHGRIQKVGSWSSNEGLNITDPTAFYDVSVANITLVVMTRKEKPYVMVKEETNLTGNARYEGFCIDLLRAIAAQAGFHYKIELVPDNMYGVYNSETTSWNGIVRELMERRADLAVASMTINYERESVIDFTKPFMNLGIGILFKVPSGQPTRLFSFMNPLAIDIWLYVLAAYLLVSFILFVMARFSPYEWNYPCHKEFDIVENQFSVSNSFWFITGTFLRQGSGLNPKATSTRIVGGIWWFFTLIVISSYTANLAAFLTVERMTTPMENAADLVEQTEISYGTLEGGSTMTFFRDSKIGVYQKMWQYMENRKPSVFVKTYEEGIKRAMEGNYAFLMESTMLDFAVQRDCNLMQIGGLLDSKGYGIATPKGSHWRDVLSLAILELQGNGITQILYDKWWKNTGDVCNRDNKRKESKANALGVENIGGVFVVLLCGLALAVVVAILEFCWNSKKNSHMERQPLCTEMAKELRFAMHFHTAKQRPALKQDCVKCSASCSTYFPMEAGMPHVSGVHSNFLH